MTSYESYRFGRSQAILPGARVYYQIDVLCALRWSDTSLESLSPRT